MSAVSICFEDRGFPVELGSRREMERAVTSGRLRADMLVTVVEPGQPLRVQRAGDVDCLSPLFEGPAELATAPPAPLALHSPEAPASYAVASGGPAQRVTTRTAPPNDRAVNMPTFVHPKTDR
jgi:hypothetical protein